VGYAAAVLESVAEPEKDEPYPASRRVVSAVAALLLLLLAAVEALTALISPLRTPSDTDWAAAAGWVKANHRAGDLLVAAPAWADQVMRLHLGDLLPVKMAGRLDHEIYARVWELSQRGAEASESAGAELREERRFGQLHVRLHERAALMLRYDFLDNWAKARVSRVEGASTVPCDLVTDQHRCPGISFNFVKPRVLEIGNTLRRGLLVQPVANATVAIEYAAVPLGRELAVGAGLHHVWRRKGGDGTVVLRALVDGREVGRCESGNRTGWRVWRFPTSGFRGRTGTVRFEITSARPFSRHFGFAAEARGA
jgi:hypothetical protein